MKTSDLLGVIFRNCHLMHSETYIKGLVFPVRIIILPCFATFERIRLGLYQHRYWEKWGVAPLPISKKRIGVPSYFQYPAQNSPMRKCKQGWDPRDANGIAQKKGVPFFLKDLLRTAQSVLHQKTIARSVF